MSTTNWAQRTKQDAAAIPVSKPAPKGDRGERFEARIEKVEAKVFKTGTIGFSVKYAVAGLERAVYANYFTRLMDKSTGDLVDNIKGAIFMDKFLTACGLTADERLAFPKLKTVTGPLAEAPVAALNSLVGAEVALYLVDETYEGKTRKSVKSIFPLDRS